MRGTSRHLLEDGRPGHPGCVHRRHARPGPRRFQTKKMQGKNNYNQIRRQRIKKNYE